MRRLITLLVMATLMLVNGTAIAAAVCVHEDAVAHAAALHDGDASTAAIAQMEDVAGAAASKRGTLADAGPLMLPAFVIPPASNAVHVPRRTPSLARFDDEPWGASRSIAPLLEPPAA